MKSVNEIAEYNPLIAEIAVLQTKFRGLVYDVTKPDQYDNAVIERKAFVKLDNQIDAVRKKVGEPHYTLYKQINEQGKTIREPLIVRIAELDALIKCQDEAQAIKNAEFERKIADIRAKPMQMAGRSSDDMQEAHNWIINHDTDSFEGYSIAAENAIKEALAQIEPMIAAQVNAEKFAAEQAKQQKVLDDRQAVLDKAEKDSQAQRDEDKRLADLEQARLDGIAQAQHDAQLQIEQAERAAQEKIDQAEHMRIAADAERLQQVQRDLEQQLEAEAIKPDQDKFLQWLELCIENAPTLQDEKMNERVQSIKNRLHAVVAEMSDKAA